MEALLCMVVGLLLVYGSYGNIVTNHIPFTPNEAING